MRSLQEFTEDELRAELARREVVQQVRKPRRIYEPNWAPVVQLCQQYVDDLAAGERIDSDTDTYVYEAVLTAIFGDSVWNYIRIMR